MELRDHDIHIIPNIIMTNIFNIDIIPYQLKFSNRLYNYIPKSILLIPCQTYHSL